MRNILASAIILVSPAAAFAETDTQMEAMCTLLQHSTTTALVAIQDMGLELSEILMNELETGGGKAVLPSKTVLDNGLESFHEVLQIAKDAQTICRGHYEPVFVETIRALS